MTYAPRRLLADRSLDWWVAVLFMLGSTCFGLGSFPAFAQLVDPGTVGLVFFVGSIFFTSAGTLQFAGVAPLGRGAGWWAAFVQLLGTVLFNLSTFDALRQGLSTEQTNRLVWAPDMFGSVAFIVASALAWGDVCRSVWCVRRDDTDWWMATWNGVGSILFMASGVASLTLPTTGAYLDLTLVNTGTFGGAVCFFAGAWLLLPKR